MTFELNRMFHGCSEDGDCKTGPAILLIGPQRVELDLAESLGLEREPPSINWPSFSARYCSDEYQACMEVSGTVDGPYVEGQLRTVMMDGRVDSMFAFIGWLVESAGYCPVECKDDGSCAVVSDHCPPADGPCEVALCEPTEGCVLAEKTCADGDDCTVDTCEPPAARASTW